MATSKRSRVIVDARANRARACQLRRAGLTLQQIGDTLGVTRQTVCRYLDATLLDLHTTARDNLDAWRSAHLAELAQVRTIAYHRIAGVPMGDPDADTGDEKVDERLRAEWEQGPSRVAPLLLTILRAMEREAKLLGLDAPVEVTGTVVTGPAMSEDDARAVLAKLGMG
jgi:predicted ArsR family transcriptional regulator